MFEYEVDRYHGVIVKLNSLSEEEIQSFADDVETVRIS